MKEKRLNLYCIVCQYAIQEKALQASAIAGCYDGTDKEEVRTKKRDTSTLKMAFRKRCATPSGRSRLLHLCRVAAFKVCEELQKPLVQKGQGQLPK